MITHIGLVRTIYFFRKIIEDKEGEGLTTPSLIQCQSSDRKKLIELLGLTGKGFGPRDKERSLEEPLANF